MTTYNICLEVDNPELYHLLLWLDEEWDYVHEKFGSTTASLWDEALGEDNVDEWVRQITQYFTRGAPSTLAGRQAIAKAAATAIAFAASCVRVHGDLPRGGTPSGEVVPR